MMLMSKIMKRDPQVKAFKMFRDRDGCICFRDVKRAAKEPLSLTNMVILELWEEVDCMNEEERQQALGETYCMNEEELQEMTDEVDDNECHTQWLNGKVKQWNELIKRARLEMIRVIDQETREPGDAD